MISSLSTPSRPVVPKSGRGKNNSGWFTVKKIAIVLVILLLFLWGIWLFAVPESFLTGYLQKSLAGGSIALELTGFQKGLFYTIHAERASLNNSRQHGNQLPASLPHEGSGEQTAFFVMQNLDIMPDIFSFLKLAPRFNFSGRVGRGFLRGAAGREHGGVTATVHGEQIDVGSMPVLAQAGIYGEGNLVFDFRWREPRGEIIFSISEARLRGIFAGNSAVPLNFFNSVKGLLTLGDTITVNSLALEGPGIYVRVKGYIREGRLAGRAEVMVDASFPQYPLLAPLLEKYKVSPGSYILPFSHADLMSGRQP